MNVHPYLHIDKSFKPCYVKKKELFLYSGRFFSRITEFFMKNLFFCLLSLSVISAAAGCRSGNSKDDLPPVTPLEKENVKISMQVNITDTAVEKRTLQPPERPVQKSNPAPEQKKVRNINRKTSRRQPSPTPARAEVPPPAGAIDSELNSVERSYVQSVRARNRKAARSSEEQVFGGFQVKNLFTPAK